MIAELLERHRQRRRASLSWRLRHRNPQRLSRAQYIAAELAQARMQADDTPGELEMIRRARAEAARRAHYGTPPLSRDEQAALLNRQLLDEVCRGRR